MKIVTWNVNSLKVRLPALLAWMKSVQPDVVALQETKLVDELFPEEALAELGYHSAFVGQKTYNGVALLTRQQPCTDIKGEVPEYVDTQRRFLAGTWNDIRFINVYIPNGSELISDKYQYKLAWLNAFQQFIQAELTRYKKVIVLGDFNIAPSDRDVHDPTVWKNCVLVSEPERAAFQVLLNLGLKDVYRELLPEGNAFSWWDYRAGAFPRNKGLRIDHILVSAALLPSCRECWIDKTVRADERPSDHAPVVLEMG